MTRKWNDFFLPQTGKGPSQIGPSQQPVSVHWLVTVISRCLMSITLKLIRLSVASSRTPGEDTLTGGSRFRSIVRFLFQGETLQPVFTRFCFVFLPLSSRLQLPFPSTRPDTPSWEPERTVSHRNLRLQHRLQASSHCSADGSAGPSYWAVYVLKSAQ